MNAMNLSAEENIICQRSQNYVPDSGSPRLQWKTKKLFLDRDPTTLE